MNQKEQIKYILRKHPATKFNRGEFMWAYCREYLGINIGLSREQFLEFWKVEAGLERELRNCLKDPEFRLEPENDARLQELKSEFKQEFRPKEPQERKDYEFVFGENKL